MEVEPNRVGQFPFRMSDPKKRKEDFSEVQQPYIKEEVMKEAERCLLCGQSLLSTEYLMNLEENHTSFYERYYKQNFYDRMLEGGKAGPPPE